MKPPMLFLLALLVTAGCASEDAARRNPQPLQETRLDTTPATPAYAVVDQTMNPVKYAATFPRALECEQAARRLKARNPDAGWAVLKACVEKGNFTSLKLLTDGFWDAELQTRKEAPVVIAKVIAQRGGDIGGDLDAVTRRRMPLFSLAAMMVQPDTYRGQYVLLRGNPAQQRNLEGKFTVMITETALSNQTSEQQVGPAHSYSGSSSGSGSGDIQTSQHGSAKISGSYSSDSSSRYTTTVERHDNSIAETGRAVLARMVKPDPFFAPGKEFIILGRFDGIRASAAKPVNEGEPEGTAVVTLIDYFEPAALIIE